MNGDGPTLSRDELELINELLSSRFGFHFPEQKKEILESRLRPRLKALGMRRFMDYYLQLSYAVNGDRAELDHLVPALTNNETYFFRETAQIEAVFSAGLDELKKKAQTSVRSIRFLCAGCSSGEEAYTLSFFVKDNQYRFGGLDVTVDAFDIDPVKLEQARLARYGANSMRGVSAEQIKRYFITGEDGRHQVKPLYRRGVRFAGGNIVDNSYFKVPSVFDVVLCRNVLIYFTEEALQRAIANFAFSLRPGGLLLLGHSESLIGKTDAFEAHRLGGSIVYRKLGG